MGAQEGHPRQRWSTARQGAQSVQRTGQRGQQAEAGLSVWRGHLPRQTLLCMLHTFHWLALERWLGLRLGLGWPRPGSTLGRSRGGGGREASLLSCRAKQQAQRSAESLLSDQGRGVGEGPAATQSTGAKLVGGAALGAGQEGVAGMAGVAGRGAVQGQEVGAEVEAGDGVRELSLPGGLAASVGVGEGSQEGEEKKVRPQPEISVPPPAPALAPATTQLGLGWCCAVLWVVVEGGGGSFSLLPPLPPWISSFTATSEGRAALCKLACSVMTA